MPSPRLDHAKQGKHIPGSRTYIPGRSTLTDPDPQESAGSVGRHRTAR